MWSFFLSRTPARRHLAVCCSFVLFQFLWKNSVEQTLKSWITGSGMAVISGLTLDKDATIQARYPLLIPSRILGPVSPGRRGLTIVR